MASAPTRSDLKNGRRSIPEIALVSIFGCASRAGPPRPRQIGAQRLIQLDLDVHARRQFQLHERIHGLVRGVQNVHQALVRADFELVARVLVAMRRGQYRKALHFDGQRHRTLDGRAGALRGIDNFTRRLIDQAMIESLQADTYVLVSHVFVSRRYAPTINGVEATPSLKGAGFYAITLATTPAPTVLPPSRMAKRKPCSIAIGAISSTTILMLSPGITISVPSGSSTAPVTSVVRK